ncbi:hypothetical protein F4819DRAFT_475316 [Hypoxylon fuscum]|nr:hypothetical protein F4819DRAFT_475316 [Hypoxylon fuscum]
MMLGFAKLSIARNFQRIFNTRKFRIVAYMVIGLCYLDAAEDTYSSESSYAIE